ncbi:cytochrome P450 2F2-like [Elephas maximus indicus]|uniref:cytochrome P450 2F2-like n=1 Tax=Elephas maximus indicus TaxID=99487 RepID=UPI002115D11B|nr:cytochrome P450 2F2-like [Elephas maximus indicus]
MMGTDLVVLLLLLLVLALARRCRGARVTLRRSALPPGPAPLPVLGNLLQLQPRRLDQALMEVEPNSGFVELPACWGPVFTVRLGPRPAVVLCGYAALRDALVLQADTFSGRGAMDVFELFTRGNGIVFFNGPRWQTLRNFALGALKEFGLGTLTIEKHVLEEAACLLSEFQATIGVPFGPRRLLDNAVSNVICSVVFGNRYGYGDPEFLRLLDLFHDNFRIMSSRWGEMYIFPSLLDWFPGPHHRILRNFAELRVFISEQIQSHRQTRQVGEPRDFIDCFLDQMDKERQDAESHFREETLVMTTHDLFFGGTKTTSTTLRYGLLILLKFPQVAAKAQAELDAVVGRMSPPPALTPSLANRACLPYTNAVLREIQRFISVLPLGLPRALTRDAHFCTVPKGTFVIPLLVSAHRDPTQFKDPDRFNPTNFLDDKSEFRSNEAFLPFAPVLPAPCGKPANIDLTPQYTGLGNVPPGFLLHLVAR